MRKQKLALLLTALLLLTGCSSGGSGDTADGQDDGELETIDVVLDWYPNAVHAFLYEAEEKGYFAEEGLQVNILFPSNASDPLTMTAAGRADIGFYYQEDTIIARANEDVPVKVLGEKHQDPGGPDRQDHRLLRHPLRRGGGGPDVGDCGRHAG